jgi:rSAM/selenodomain-associated transferase 1
MKRLALFARWPEPGRVKTRLIPALTAPLACRLHRALLADAISLLADAPADERWLYWADAALDARPSQADAGPESGVASPADGTGVIHVLAGVREREQSGVDLGQRLARAFGELLAGGARAVVIGSDCPWLGAAHMSHAFAALDRADVAIAPASDGGYTLIGLREVQPELFRGIEWGTSSVLARTLERASAGGLQVERLETLDDLDTAEDLLRAITHLAAERVHATDGSAERSLNLMRELEKMGLLPREMEKSHAPLTDR